MCFENKTYVLVQIKIMQVTPHNGQQNWTIFISLKSNHAKTRKNMLILCYYHSGNHGNGKQYSSKMVLKSTEIAQF